MSDQYHIPFRTEAELKKLTIGMHLMGHLRNNFYIPITRKGISGLAKSVRRSGACFEGSVIASHKKGYAHIYFNI